MSDALKRMQELKGALASGEEKLARVRLRLDALEPERDELDRDLQRLATVRLELVAMAAHSDEAYAKLRPHDRNVAELVQRKDDLDAMILQLQAEQSGIESAIAADRDALGRAETAHNKATGDKLLNDFAKRHRDELAAIAYARQYGTDFRREWRLGKDAMADALFPADPASLSRGDKDALRFKLTDGLIGAPASQ